MILVVVVDIAKMGAYYLEAHPGTQVLLDIATMAVGRIVDSPHRYLLVDPADRG